MLNSPLTPIAGRGFLLTADVQGQGMGVGLDPSQPLAIMANARKVKNYHYMLISKGHPYREGKEQHIPMTPQRNISFAWIPREGRTPLLRSLLSQCSFKGFILSLAEYWWRSIPTCIALFPTLGFIWNLMILTLIPGAGIMVLPEDLCFHYKHTTILICITHRLYQVLYFEWRCGS